MFRRNHISATLGIVLSISLLICSGSRQAAACPDEYDTLYSLYMSSEIIVLAELRSERDLRKTEESEDGFYVDVQRNLDIIETFKGDHQRKISLINSEYRGKDNPAEGEETLYFDDFGRNMVDHLTVGKRYMFFLNRNPETGQFEHASYQGVRKVGANSAGIYKKRFAELAALLGSKQNKTAGFAEWLVRLIEDPETVWDGAYLLYGSFDRLEYAQENPENSGSSPDEEFSAYSSEFAKSLSASQKERISAVLYKSLNNTDLPDSSTDFTLIGIVSRWEKMRLAMYAFNLLEATDSEDSVRQIRLMRIISDIIEDSELYELSAGYRNLFDEESAAGEANPGVQLRKEVFSDFIDRYQVLLVNNFEKTARSSKP